MLAASRKCLWTSYRSQQGHEATGNTAMNTLPIGTTQPSLAKPVSLAYFYLLMLTLKTIAICKENADWIAGHVPTLNLLSHKRKYKNFWAGGRVSG